jgi:hypothetical protein
MIREMYHLNIQGQSQAKQETSVKQTAGRTPVDRYFDLEYLGGMFLFLQTASVRN